LMRAKIERYGYNLWHIKIYLNLVFMVR
jgi:hypothetical protein